MSRREGTSRSGRGLFVVFEGGEGSGKSTQASLLAERWDALLTREPGGTALGSALRGVLLEPTGAALDPRAEALLMAADRAQHVHEVLRPGLEAGRNVVCDRYVGSSVAYQGYGRGLDPAWVQRMSKWATGGLEPDLVVLLDLDDEVASGRTGGPRDRIEAAGAEFHRRVREGFLRQAGEDPGRWVVLDGTRGITEVHGEVVRLLGERFGALVEDR